MVYNYKEDFVGDFFSNKLNTKNKPSSIDYFKSFALDDERFKKLTVQEIHLQHKTIMLIDYQLNKELLLENTTIDDFTIMHFNLGKPITFCHESMVEFSVPSMHHNLFSLTKGTFGGIKFSNGKRYKTFDVYLSKTYVNELYNKNKKLGSLLERVKNDNAPKTLYNENKPITPNMFTIISEISTCNLDKSCKELFLDAKIQELLSLQLQQRFYEEEFEYLKHKFTEEDAKKINFVKKYIENNLTSQVTIAELSKIGRINQQKLKQGFKVLLGTTVFKYAKTYRMDFAKKYLEEGEYAGDVWAKVGYSDLSSFSSAFKKYFGIAPSQIVKK